MMVTAFVIAGLAAGFGWAQLVSTPAHAAAPPPAQVKVVDAPDPNQPKGYEPADITVKVHQAVNWQNTGHEEHSVPADDKSFDSGMKKHGAGLQWTFARAGLYAYHCAPHPWMTGKIHVVAGAAPAPVRSAADASTSTTAATVPPSPPTTAAPAAAPPPTGSPAPGGGGGSNPGPAEAKGSPTSTAKPAGAGEAAPAGSHHRSGRHLAGTIALVLGPTLAGLALGAKLRQSR